MVSKDISAKLLWQKQFQERLQLLVRRRLIAMPVAGTIALSLAWFDGHRLRLVIMGLVLFVQMAVAVYYAWQMRRRELTEADVLPNVITLASGGALAIYVTGDVHSPIVAGIVLPAAFLGGLFGAGPLRKVFLVPVAFFSMLVVGAGLGFIPRFPPLLAAYPLEYTVTQTCVIIFVAIQVWRIVVWMLTDAATLTRELENANEQLAAEIESSQRTTGLLVSQLAHEIRNPLASIKGLHQLVRGAPAGENTPAHLQVISEEIERLEQTVDAALDFGKPAQQEEQSFFEVQSPFNSALRILQVKALRKNLEVNVAWEAPFTIRGDEQAWRQVFFNLLLNAIDALPEGGMIHVSARRTGDRLQLCVQDNGPGIPADIAASIWEPYVTAKAGGTGLGLSIVRQVVRNHDGEAALESEPGRGTAVTLTLPLQRVGL